MDIPSDNSRKRNTPSLSISSVPKVYLTKPTPPADLHTLSSTSENLSHQSSQSKNSTPPLSLIRDTERQRTSRVRIEDSSMLSPGGNDDDDAISVTSQETARVRQQILQLPFFKRVAVGSGHILNDLCASLWFSYLLLYLQKVVGFSSDYAAGLMLLGQIVDAISTPLVGYEADRPNNCFLCRKNYGRCKSWHLIGIVLVAFSFPFVFTTCIGCSNSDDWAKLIYYAPFIAIFQIGWASTQISHLALIPKMSPDQLVRTELLAIRYSFTIASNVTVFLMTWFVLGFSEDCIIDQDDAPDFRNIALSAVGIGIFFSIIFHIFVKEQPDDKVKKVVAQLKSQGSLTESITHSGDHGSQSSSNTLVRRKNIRSRTPDNLLQSCGGDDSDEESSQALLSDMENNAEELVTNAPEIISHIPESHDVFISTPRSLSTRFLNLGKEKMTLKDWLGLPQFYLVAIMYMSTRLSVNVTQVYMPLYLQYSLRLPCMTVATIPLTMYLSGFVVAIFIKIINKYLGRQLAYTFGASLCIAGSACVLFLDLTPGGSEKGIYAVAAVLGGGASAILVTSLSITADLIGNNVENGAFVYGAMSFSDKLSCGLVIMLINGLVPCQKSTDQCNGSLSMLPFYSQVLGYACGGCALIGVMAVGAMTYLIYANNRRLQNEEKQEFN